MKAQRPSFDLVLGYATVFAASLGVALPWALSGPLADVVSDFSRSHFYGKPPPPFTGALLSLRPYAPGGALALVILLCLAGSSLVRFWRQPVRGILFFVLIAVVLAGLSFTFVCVALILPLVLLVR